MTHGVVMVGRLFCTFTLFTNEEPSAETDLALAMLRGAHHQNDT